MLGFRLFFLIFMCWVILLLFLWVLLHLVLKTLTFADRFPHGELLDVLEFAMLIFNIFLQICSLNIIWFLGRSVYLQRSLWRNITFYDVILYIVLVSEHLRLDSIPSLFIFGRSYWLRRLFLPNVCIFFIVFEFRYIDKLALQFLMSICWIGRRKN